jgi:hypothetical protein
VTDAELAILREAAIGPVRGARAGEHVTLEVAAAAVSRNGSEWERVGAHEAQGWVDNLTDATVMLYDREVVTAVRFYEVMAVRWRQAREVMTVRQK